MNNTLKNILILLFGVLLGATIVVAFKKPDIVPFMKELNNNYAALLGAISSVVLVGITLIYVVLTYFQAESAKKTVALSYQLIEQAERQLKHSNVPVLICEVIKTDGTECFVKRRRQLHVTVQVKNIGNGPAINVYIKMKFIYKYVEEIFKDAIYEYSFIGSLSANEIKNAELHFETNKIDKLIEDLSIKYSKNAFRVKNQPNDPPYKSADLAIEIICSNVHGQYFRTELIHPIGFIEAYQRETENEKYIYWRTEKSLKDDEPFKLSLINPIFQSFSFDALSSDDASRFINRYRELV